MPHRVGQLWRGVRDFLWGLFVFDTYKETLHQRERYEEVMNVILFGEMLGIPLMNSVISLRLLPYVVGDLEEWKRRQAREVEVLEYAPDLH